MDINIILIVLGIILVVIILMQIVWVRAKIANFSKAKLSSELRLSDRFASACPAGNIMIHALVVDTVMTGKLNNPVSDEFSMYRPGVDRKKIVLPYVCTNSSSKGIVSLTTMMTQVFSLCIDITPSAYELDSLLKTQPQIYMMINEKIYLGGCDDILLESLRKVNSYFNDKLIVNLYAVRSDQNEIMDYTVSGCQMTMVPFFGKLTTGIPGIVEEMFKTLGIENSGTGKAVVNSLSWGLT
jgi:hypothetical protein